MEIKEKKTALVVGAGVIGVTTAYYLNQIGYSVTVVDKLDGAAAKGSCSYQNGGLICPGLSEPWARPTAFKVFLKSLVNPLAGFKFRFGRHLFDSHFWKWLYLFHGYSSAGIVDYNHRWFSMQQLAFYSAQEYKSLISKHPAVLYPPTEKGTIEQKQQASSAGVLAIYQSREHCLAEINELNNFRNKLGLKHYQWFTDQPTGEPGGHVAEIIRKFIPSIKDKYAKTIQGIWISPDEFSANCQTFTTSLAELLQRHGVKFHFRSLAEKITHDRNGKVTGIILQGGQNLQADKYIITTGASVKLFHDIGEVIPVVPMKGYSLDIPIKAREMTQSCELPVISVANEDNGIYVSRIHESIRVVGFAELDGGTSADNNKRFDQLANYAKDNLGFDLDYENARKYSCHRPVSADGLPIIGRVSNFQNLYVNVGHAQLGWTLACGAGNLIANIVHGTEEDLGTKLNYTAFDPNRFKSYKKQK